jgi:hypothetical protein
MRRLRAAIKFVHGRSWLPVWCARFVRRARSIGDGVGGRVHLAGLLPQVRPLTCKASQALRRPRPSPAGPAIQYYRLNQLDC